MVYECCKFVALRLVYIMLEQIMIRCTDNDVQIMLLRT
jgi:hypothetical protein